LFLSYIRVCVNRAGILEKLAHAPVTSFDDADLHQIFQAYLLLDQQSASLVRATVAAAAAAHIAKVDRSNCCPFSSGCHFFKLPTVVI